MLTVLLALLIAACGSRSVPSTSARTTGEPAAPWQAAPAAIVHDVTNLPGAVFDSVGLQPAVTPPVALQSQPALKFDGKPGVYYLGAEPCPLCAAERWAFIAATSRFGTWSNLGIDSSARDDVDPDTQTFTFARASFSSPYIAIRTVEHLSSHQLANGQYAVLQQATPQEATLADRYDSAKYFPSNPGSYPFLDFGNRTVVSGASYDPGVLQGLSRAQIAADLSDPMNPITKDVLATANYLAAALCGIDGGNPVSVCTSTGVIEARSFSVHAPAPHGSCPATPQVGQAVCGANSSFTKPG